MIDKNILLKERISLMNGMLFYMDTHLKLIDSEDNQMYFGILPNNEKIKITISNDTLITYKEYMEEDYKVFNYSIRNKELHSKILIKDKDKLEIFLSNSNKDDAYISIDKNIHHNSPFLLKIIERKLELGSIFNLIEESIDNNINNNFNSIKNKKYTKKR